MDSKPGPSSVKDHLGIEQPKKKHKFEDNHDHVGSQNSSTHINDLPDEMLIKIFKYLSVPDRLKAEKVCNRWNLLLRSEVFWKYVKLLDVSNSFLIEILVSLPACVSELKLVCRSEDLPISLSELMTKLHDKCPLLESFHLADIHLLKDLHSAPYCHTRKCKLYNSFFVERATETLDDHTIQVIESEFREEEDVGLTKAVLPQLKILSMRRVLFSLSHAMSHISAFVLPKLVVLDLSHSQPIAMKGVDLFSSLSDLEELYLVDWKIADATLEKFIRNAKKLRVLDLEHNGVMKKTVLALERYCNGLEELYLSFNLMGDISRTIKDQEFFPRLRTLCLKCTDVTPKGVEKLVTECPSLKLVDVCDSVNTDINQIWYRRLSKDLKEKIRYYPDEKITYCDHFSQNNRRLSRKL